MSRPSGRPRSSDVDERIVAATRAWLHEAGIDAVSIASVAARAGVGRPTVYRRFPDRDALLIAVLYDDFEVRVVQSRDVPTAVPIADQIVAIFGLFLRYYAERPHLSRAMLELAMFSHAAERQRLDQQLFGFLGTITARLETARDRGELAADADLRAATLAVFACYTMTALAGTQGMIPDIEAQLELYRAMVAQQLRGAAPSPDEVRAPTR